MDIFKFENHYFAIVSDLFHYLHLTLYFLIEVNKGNSEVASERNLRMGCR